MKMVVEVTYRVGHHQTQKLRVFEVYSEEMGKFLLRRLQRDTTILTYKFIEFRN